MTQIFTLRKLIQFTYIIILITSATFAQKKKPSLPSDIARPDTIVVIQEQLAPEPEDQSVVEKIETKEHTIVGTRTITDVPNTEKTIDKTNVPFITENPTGDSKSNRTAPGAGGIKTNKSIFRPTPYIDNEIYSSYGRYNDVNAGFKLRKQYIDDELFADADFRWNGGHIKNSEFTKFSGILSNIHRFNRYIQNKTQFDISQYTYHFFGAKNNQDEQRARFNTNISTTTSVTNWKPLTMRWDGGVHYMDPDNSQLFNWGGWTNLHLSKTLGSTFLFSNFNVLVDRIEEPLNDAQLDSLHAWIATHLNEEPIDYLDKIRDDITDNSLLSDVAFVNSRLTAEHVFGQNLKLKGGAGLFYFNSNNQHAAIYPDKPFEPAIHNDELSAIYPIFTAEFNLGPMGSLFTEYEPKIEAITLAQLLNTNPYLNMTAPLSYNDIVNNISIGWRRGGSYDLSFETYYNYRDINNFGFFNETEADSGHWDIIYDNDITQHEIRANLNWRISNYLGLWSSIGYRDYKIKKSQINAEQIPYFPNLDFNVSMRVTPGLGVQFLLDGKLVGEQFTSPVKAIGSKDIVIAPHFIANFGISKLIGEHFEIYLQVNNLLNQNYEVWRGYSAPPINGWVGIKFLW